MNKKRTCLLAGFAAAAAAILMASYSFGSVAKAESNEARKNAFASDARIKINSKAVSAKARYYDTTINGTTVEVFAVRASDGTVRLALNTCQVCNGSPYAYFKQQGNDFVCQNCGNRFSSDEIGLTSWGCNPVPITKDDCAEENGIITVSNSFLEDNAPRFSRWKKF